MCAYVHGPRVIVVTAAFKHVILCFLKFTASTFRPVHRNQVDEMLPICSLLKQLHTKLTFDSVLKVAMHLKLRTGRETCIDV